MLRCYLVGFFFVLFSQELIAEEAVTLILAIDHAPPYSYVLDKENPRGLSVDVVKALTEKVNVKLEIIPCPWARCLALGEAGNADIIAGVFKTPAREKLFKYIEPSYFSANKSISFFSLKNGPKITSEGDLTKLRIGVHRGVTYLPRFEQNDTLDKVPFNSVKTMIDMLKKGRIDTFIHVTDTVKPFLARFDAESTIQGSAFTYTISDIDNAGYVMMSKRSTHLDMVPLLNKAMLELKQQGHLKQIRDRYLKP